MTKSVEPKEDYRVLMGSTWTKMRGNILLVWLNFYPEEIITYERA